MRTLNSSNKKSSETVGLFAITHLYLTSIKLSSDWNVVILESNAIFVLKLRLLL